jgi:hypothetical protein
VRVTALAAILITVWWNQRTFAENALWARFERSALSVGVLGNILPHIVRIAYFVEKTGMAVHVL